MLKYLNHINIKGAANILISIVSMLISFMISILLTNYFGAEVYGDYLVAFSWIEIFAASALIGLDQLLKVYVPQNINNRSAVRYIFSKYHKWILYTSILLTIITFSVSFLELPFYTGPYTKLFFRYGSLTIPLFTSSLFRQHFIIGLKKVITAQLPEKIIKPILFLLISILIWRYNAATENLIYVYTISVIVTFLIGLIILSKSVNKVPNNNAPFNLSGIKEGIYYLTTINILSIFSNKIDTFMLGSILTTSEAGIYNILFKLSSFITLFLAGVRVVLAPNISELIGKNELNKAREMIKISSRFSLLLGFLSFGILLVFKNSIFNLFDTSVFLKENTFSFYILCMMQLFSLTVGPVASIMLVSKSFKALFYGQIILCSTNIFFNIILIPKLHLTGAAIATIISVICWYSFLLIINYKKQNINPTAFGK